MTKNVKDITKNLLIEDMVILSVRPHQKKRGNKNMELKFKHFVFLQALDVITTFLGLTYFGLREANTFANGIFQEYGLIFTLVGMKLIGLMIIYLVLYVYPLNIKKLALNIICFMFVIVVMNNLYRIYEVI